MMENKKYWNFYKLDFDVYKVEVGVLLDKNNTEYKYYNDVYDKKNSYFEENTALFLDYNKAKEYAKNYVNDGVDGTYSIISRLHYNSEDIYGSGNDKTIYYVMNDINYILGNGYVEDIGMFNNLYSVDNIIYSLYKTRDNGDVLENFVDKC